jgi:hypothetical protein
MAKIKYLIEWKALSHGGRSSQGPNTSTFEAESETNAIALFHKQHKSTGDKTYRVISIKPK